MLGVAAILLIGFLGKAIAKKTKIPNVVWLIIFGLILFPVLNFVPTSTLIYYTPFASSIVIIILLFNAGLNFNMRKLFREVSRASLLAVVNFILAAIAAFLLMYFLKAGTLASLLTGLAVGSVSAVAIPSINRPDKSKDKSSLLVTIESTITEPLGIILVLVVISAVLLNNYNANFIATTLASEFSTGIVVGGLFALAWIPTMSYFQRLHYEYSYAASLALVFIVYVLVQEIGGSGPISALIFGLIIANGEDIYRALKYRHSSSFTLSKESKSFNDLISFITMSFFFVYLGGLIIPNDYLYLALGVLIGLVVLITREIGTHIALFKSAFSDYDKRIISYMFSRGSGTAIIAVLPIAYGILNVGFIDIIISAILTTIVLSGALLTHINAQEMI
jgi:NhaP-type Na+/H+ or K+/H+ antiporter